MGASRQPRYFGGQTSADLGIDYCSSAKAWMNTELFQRWLSRFDDSMRTEGRHVLLLLDNASAHRVTSPLTNVTIQMLPPNTTAFLQPQDAGVIRQFKVQIRRQQTHHVLGAIELELERQVATTNPTHRLGQIYKIDVLTAMQWAQVAWAAVTAATIAACWRHTQVLDDDMYGLESRMANVSIS